MTKSTNGQLDQLVKARWLALGLSQSDLADVLGAALEPVRRDGNGSDCGDRTRLMQVADALAIPIGFSPGTAVSAEPEEHDLPSQILISSQSLLELRLLRTFHELQDYRTKLMLVHLAEQFVKRQDNRRGDAG
jgi:hypothetical protein